MDLGYLFLPRGAADVALAGPDPSHHGRRAVVSALEEAAGTSVANTSQHLRRLMVGGIVGRRREGNQVHYRSVDDSIEQLCEIVCASVGGRAELAGRTVRD